MMDILAVGEVLIDFTPAGTNGQGAGLFACNPGGAPANVLAMNARLGGTGAFIGKVGDDAFGRFLRRTLEESGVDVSGLVVDRFIPTTLAFVQLDEDGDRTFTFYRNPGADVMLRPEDISPAQIDDCEVFHFGSVSLTADPSRTATLEAARFAKNRGKRISFDPNYRPLLWEDAALARRWMEEGVRMADLLKVSEEEMSLLTGETDLLAGSGQLLSMGPSLVLVTLGRGGAFYRNGRCCGHLPAYDVKTVDTTGAGDAFTGAVLHCLRGKTADDLERLGNAELREMVDFANAAGSLTTAGNGAIPALPTAEDIAACRRDVPLLQC